MVTIAKTFAKDVAACCAIRDIARCPKNDAEKALQKVLRKFDLTLDIPVTTLQLTRDLAVPCLLPTDFIRSLHEKGFLNKLLAGSLNTSPLVFKGAEFTYLVALFVVLFGVAFKSYRAVVALWRISTGFLLRI